MTSIIRSKIIGFGSYLPEKVLSNDDLAKMVDTSDEWIVERTGIRNRHIADDGVFTSDLATFAAREALYNAGIEEKDIDLIILATTSPDHTFPSTAVKVQKNLKMSNGAAFDVQAVCSGFLYGLTIADNFIKTGQAKKVLLIGAETMSRLLDWTDRNTCILFGDGAGAVVLSGEGTGEKTDTGVLATAIHSNGDYHDTLYMDGGPSSTKTVGKIKMKGAELFKVAVQYLSDVSLEVMKKAGVKPENLNWLVPHQANLRIIKGMAKKLKMSMEQVLVTIHEHANTSAASIPLALADGMKKGLLKKNDLILMESMGGGLTWGAALVRL